MFELAVEYLSVPVALTVAWLLIAAVLVGAVRLAIGKRSANAVGRWSLVVACLVPIIALTMLGYHNDAEYGHFVNLMPFQEITRDLTRMDQERGYVNLAGNILMFVPLGAALVGALRVRVSQAIVVCLLLSICIEIVQYGIGRSADIDDVMLNTVGGALGAVLGLIWRPSAPESRPRAARTSATSGRQRRD